MELCPRGTNNLMEYSKITNLVAVGEVPLAQKKRLKQDVQEEVLSKGRHE